MREKGFALPLILIGIILLAVVVGGGLLVWQFLLPKEEIIKSESTVSPKTETAIKDFIYGFYDAIENQNGDLVMSYFTPAATSEEKESQDWLTGADLPEPMYRIFLRVRISDPSIINIQKIEEVGKFQAKVVDEFQWYSNVTAKWSEPVKRNLTFVIVQEGDKWLVEKYLLEESTQKYSGFGHEPMRKDESAKETFNLARIKRSVSFYDSKGNEKKMFVYDTFTENGQTGIYLTNRSLTWDSAVKIIDIIGSDIRNSPFVSWGNNGKKYIVIELLAGDNLDLVIADEDGKIITRSVKSENKEFSAYLFSFDQWESTNTFLAKATPYPEGLQPFKVLIDAATGRIIKRTPL